jgi:predicted negative regulator of RcsB-dependent stress response
LARLSRHELKQDEFQTTVEAFEHFAKQNYKQIILAVAVALLVAGSILGWNTYNGRQQAAANAALADALKTFNASVGGPAPNLFGGAQQPQPPAGEFATDQDKYKKALAQFREIVAKYPRQTAAGFARYHVGLCQAALGDSTAALKTLEAAGSVSDRDVASLAKLALGAELARTGKTDQAIKTYKDLASRPTSTVPEATALLALADLYRVSQPGEARAIYEKLQKDYSTDAYLSSAVKEQLASLPK